MSFNYNKLKGRIVEFFQTQQAFANAMGISGRTLSLKLRNRVAWTQADIVKAIGLLKLTPEDIVEYFFKH